jgi:XTP/dITP diphosphohydrolase
VQTLLIATANRGKVTEIRQFLSSFTLQVTGLETLTDIAPCQETGATCAENARQKAEYYSQFAGGLTLADDSGLVVDALDGNPGVCSARFVSPSATDQERCREVLRLMDAVPEASRQARFVCCLALARRGKFLDLFEGIVEGLITHEPRGEQGFGYDPIFLIPEIGNTMSELAAEKKLLVSHRGMALQKLADSLAHLLPLAPQASTGTGF